MDRIAPILALLVAFLVAFSAGSGVRPRCLARSGMGNGMAFARRRALVSGPPPAGN
jgi:hypothetical protein